MTIHISWADSKLEKACATERTAKRAFGPARWAKLRMRVAVLEQAESFAALAHAPGRWHPLSADRGGQWAASLDGSFRLIVKPNDNPLPLLADGGLDTARARRALIVEVVNYHGR